MIRLTHLLAALAVVGVPFFGWFVGGWSGATTVLVYWFETLAASMFVAARILVHRRVNPRRGHFRYEASATNRRSVSNSSFLSSFMTTTLIFTAAHGVFLGVILFLLGRNGQSDLADIDWRSVAYASLLVLAILSVDCVADMFAVRRWSFWQIEQLAQRGFSRVVVVHLTLIFGLLGVALTGATSALFGVFVVLKSLAALSFVLPQWEPAKPPRWLSRAMNRIPNAHPGERFEDFWITDRARERARREHNEQPWSPKVDSSAPAATDGSGSQHR